MRFFLTTLFLGFCLATFSQTEPIAFSPNNGVPTNARPVLVISSNSSSFKYFQFELDTSNSFSSPLRLRSNWQNTATYPVLSDSMIFNRTYYWHIRSVKQVSSTQYDTTAWSTVAYFNTGTRPTYQSSSRIFPFSGNSGTISLSTVPAIRRVYETDTARSFSSPLFHRDTVTSNSLKVANLRFGTTYYLRYREITSLSTSVYSDTASINTSSYGANISQPSPGSTWSPNFFMQITANTDLNLFQAEIDTALLFNSPLHRSYNYTRYSSSNNQIFWGPDLRVKTKYYMRVRAIAPVDTSAWITTNITTMETPYLSSPNTNSGNVSTTTAVQILNPNRSWGQIQLDSTAAFNSAYLKNYAAYVGDSTLSYAQSISASFGNFGFGRKYYYRARYYNSVDTSAWTSAWNFTTINPYTFINFPGNGSTGVDINTQISWSSVKGVGGYHVQLSKDSFNTIAKERFVMGEDSFFTYMATQPNTLYDVRIRLFNGVDSTAWRSATRFRTHLPDVVKIAPTDSAGVLNDSIPFKWRSAGAQYRYEIGVWSDKNFVTRIFTDSTNDTLFYYHPVSRGKMYFWDVKPIDGSFKDPSWYYGRDWAFVPMLAAPSLTSPADGAINQPLNNLVFHWDAVPFAKGYRVEMATSPAFDNPLTNNVPVTNQVLNNLPANTTVFWRVRAYNDFLGSYSAVFSFTTGSATGIEDVSAANRCSVFPNPFSDRLTIRIPATLQGGGASISLYNLQGQLLRSMPLTGSECELSTESLMEGIYLYRISSGEGIQTGKLVKTK